MVSKITESVVGVTEYPAAEETMHAMTQAKADTLGRPRAVWRARARYGRYDAVVVTAVEESTRTALAIFPSPEGTIRLAGASEALRLKIGSLFGSFSGCRPEKERHLHAVETN